MADEKIADVLNLDAARAARREKSGEVPQFVFGGETFTLPVELPFTILIEMGKGEDGPAVILEKLLDKQWNNFLKHGPTVPDIEELFEYVNKVYGVGVGNGSSSST